MGSTPDALKYASIGLNALGALSNKGAVGADALGFARQIQQDDLQSQDRARLQSERDLAAQNLLDQQIETGAYVDNQPGVPASLQNYITGLNDNGNPQAAANELQQFLARRESKSGAGNKDLDQVEGAYAHQISGANQEAAAARKQEGDIKYTLKGDLDAVRAGILEKVREQMKTKGSVESEALLKDKNRYSLYAAEMKQRGLTPKVDDIKLLDAFVFPRIINDPWLGFNSMKDAPDDADLSNGPVGQAGAAEKRMRELGAAAAAAEARSQSLGAERDSIIRPTIDAMKKRLNPGYKAAEPTRTTAAGGGLAPKSAAPAAFDAAKEKRYQEYLKSRNAPKP